MIELRGLFVGNLSIGESSYTRFRILSESSVRWDAINKESYFPRYHQRGFIDKLIFNFSIFFSSRCFTREIALALKSRHYDYLWIDGCDVVHLNKLPIQNSTRTFHYTPDSLLSWPYKSKILRNRLRGFDVLLHSKTQDINIYNQYHQHYLVPQVAGFHFEYNSEVDMPLCDLIFVGRGNSRRVKNILRLAEATNCKIAVYGPFWDIKTKATNLEVYNPIYGQDYLNALRASRVCIVMLNVNVGDKDTTRLFEAFLAQKVCLCLDDVDTNVYWHCVNVSEFFSVSDAINFCFELSDTIDWNRSYSQPSFKDSIETILCSS